MHRQAMQCYWCQHRQTCRSQPRGRCLLYPVPITASPVAARPAHRPNPGPGLLSRLGSRRLPLSPRGRLPPGLCSDRLRASLPAQTGSGRPQVLPAALSGSQRLAAAHGSVCLRPGRISACSGRWLRFGLVFRPALSLFSPDRPESGPVPLPAAHVSAGRENRASRGRITHRH
jgi:hypothetical protein